RPDGDARLAGRAGRGPRGAGAVPDVRRDAAVALPPAPDRRAAARARRAGGPPDRPRGAPRAPAVARGRGAGRPAAPVRAAGRVARGGAAPGWSTVTHRPRPASGAPMIPLSVLDLAPIPAGSTAADALRDSLDLARRVERLG